MLTTVSGGIAQSDIIVREAIRAGIAEIRENAALLDYCFASLSQDQLTADRYGYGTVEKAKQWFRNTDIPVKIDIAVVNPKFPLVTITLQSSNEELDTLGQVNYDVAEQSIATPWNPLAAPFPCESYDPDAGTVVLPAAIVDAVQLFPGMVLIDRNGVVCTILVVQNANTVLIKPVVADFTLTTLKYAQPSNITTLESAGFAETFQIACHVQGEVEPLLWLHSIVMFVLMRGRQQYFEARGFDRGIISAGPAGRSDWSGVENVYTRGITLNGLVRHYWPKITGLAVQGVRVITAMGAQGHKTIGQDLANNPWVLDGDVGEDLP